ncbi:hypothetical protein CcCBS67573_g10529 [Chytriomyces confervae]|uniref:Uncharacterized protein n=1 Tax=Chytriomyces confervae TaxID=246404 RepID=A0A507CST3_9FUNG|nr:hypothetical protein CcCBS67573_g10529 [Chytriomyces confervae]
MSGNSLFHPHKLQTHSDEFIGTTWIHLHPQRYVNTCIHNVRLCSTSTSFIIVIMSDSRLFAGAFNTWVQLPSEWIPKVSQVNSFLSITHLHALTDHSIAEALHEQAIKRKAARDYSEAARMFSRAAHSFSAAEPGSYEAANSHTEAAKCYNVLTQWNPAGSSSLEAAAMYKRSDETWTHAAKNWDVTNEVAEIADAGDSRAYHVDTARVDLLCTLGQCADAIPLFETLSAHTITIPTLKFSVCLFLGNALFCRIYMHDQAGLERALNVYTEEYPLFADVEPIWRMFVQAWIAGDVEIFESVEVKFRMMNTVSKGSWQDQSILSVKGNFF